MATSEEIIAKAKSYLGQKEIAGNQGFVNPAFDKEMRSVGFVNGYAWCALFCKLIWKHFGFKGNTMIVPGVLNTMRNFKKAYNYDLQAKPKVGSLAIFRTYKRGIKQETGHMALVMGAKDYEFYTIEGNTNAHGGREGIEVAAKTRQYDWNENDGLRLLGFIHPDIE